MPCDKLEVTATGTGVDAAVVEGDDGTECGEEDWIPVDRATGEVSSTLEGDT